MYSPGLEGPSPRDDEGTEVDTPVDVVAGSLTRIGPWKLRLPKGSRLGLVLRSNMAAVVWWAPYGGGGWDGVEEALPPLLFSGVV